MNFNDNFERLCKRQGTTRSEVLRSIGASTSKVTAWANGSIPRPAMLEKLAKALNCTVADFFASDPSSVKVSVSYPAEPLPFVPETKPISVSKVSAPEGLSASERQLLTVFRALNRRDRYALMAYCYGLPSASAFAEVGISVNPSEATLLDDPH